MNMSKSMGNKGESAPGDRCALILYEDFSTALRAKTWLEQSTIGGQCPATTWSTEFWSTDLLQYPLLREQITIRAAAARLLLLSVEKSEAWPPEITDWITCWCEQAADRPFTLVVVFNSHDRGLLAAESVVSVAARIAEETHVEFVPAAWHLPEETITMPELPHPSVLSSTVRKLEPPHSHWGLNE